MRIDSPLKLHNDDFILLEKLYTTQEEKYLESELHTTVIDRLSEIFNDTRCNDLFDSKVRDSADLSNLSIKYAGVVNRLCDSAQYHFLVSFNFEGINGVLDLTQDTGGVTHFIADKVNYVDSIKTDYGLAKLSSKRCASRPNTSHFHSDCKKIELPKNTYDLIVIGQLEQLHLTLEDLDALIANLRQSLTASGVLIINAQNSTRLSRLLNHGSDPIKYGDSYIAKDQTNDLKLTELRRTVLSHDFSKTKIFATFSQKKRVDNVFSEDYLTSNVHCLNHFYNLGYLDDANRSEYLLFNRLAEDKERLFDLASRYIGVFGQTTETVNRLISLDFAHYRTAIADHPKKLVSFRQRAANSVSRCLINGSSNDTIQTPFISGELLAGKWLKIMTSGDIDQLKIEIARYRSWLADLEPVQFEQSASIALPSTIIIKARSGEYCLTHPLSSNTDSWTVDHVVLRGLFWFATENRPIFSAFARTHDIHSIANFVERCLPEIAIDVELKGFVEEEQKRHDLIKQEGLKTDISSQFYQLIDEPSSPSIDHTSSKIDKESNSLRNALDQKDQSLALAQKEITGNLARINQLTQHREDLLTLVETVERRVKTERNVQGNLYAQIEHLQARLHARRVENEELNKINNELHQFILVRPTTRIKNTVRGWINRCLLYTSPSPRD